LGIAEQSIDVDSVSSCSLVLVADLT
jgi:hypothetical protein